jgi:glutamyl-tRNA synthetase/glutamyl-Q tRNA(Asp) synthetase
MHLGHLVNAMHVWGIARAHGGEVLLRIEDHDRTRCRPEYETALLDDLEWLGLEADIHPVSSFRAIPSGRDHPSRQSDQTSRYASALHRLTADHLVYACRCTRRDIAQLVPHAPGEEPRYPGICRDRHVDDAESWARRVRLDPTTFDFHDLRLGPQVQAPWQQCGDVLVRDRHGQWTYQFAVVVDDLTHGVDVVIRGEDLLTSTGRQLQLASLLGRESAPLFLHHTLLVHADGSKLSKANRDTSLRDLRSDGATAEGLLGEAAVRAGLLSTHRSLTALDLPFLFA